MLKFKIFKEEIIIPKWNFTAVKFLALYFRLHTLSPEKSKNVFSYADPYSSAKRNIKSHAMKDFTSV